MVAVPLAVVTWIGWRSQRYITTVSDFLAGGRVAGRYVVAVAGGTASMGLITVIAAFEMYYRSGFVLGFWDACLTPVMLIVALTGFGVYRFRETRAMTLAQFLELRYSRRFRIFAGLLAWTSGVVNYAIFPAIGSRFIIYYGGLPDTFMLGSLPIPTAAVVMAGFLALALFVVMLGGQLTTMVTDCVAGLFTFAMYAVVVVSILLLFSWTQMKEALFDRPPAQSMVNPFDTADVSDFNLFFTTIMVLGNVYNVMSWQGSQGYNAAAVNPHEQKMGKVLGMWRAGMNTLMVLLLTIAAFTYMHHADYAAGAEMVNAELTARTAEMGEVTGATIREQMLVPVAVKHILPIGVTGLFFAVMIFLMVSTDTTCLHSWGSILVQDVVLPIRGRPMTPRAQMWLLRTAMVAVAVFAFVFSLFFNQVTFIFMFMALTGSIWMGGAGAVILGGLYTRWGTTAGAWAGLLTGAGFAVTSFLLTQYWSDPIYPYLAAHHAGAMDLWSARLAWFSEVVPFIDWRVTPHAFPISGVELYMFSIFAAIPAYVIGSLLIGRQRFNLERMLHRGKYQRPEDRPGPPPVLGQPLRQWKRILLGFDEQFSFGDKLLATGVTLYSISLFSVFLGVLIWDRLIQPLTDEGWATYFWIMNILVALIIGFITTIWFTWGGIRDLRMMFHRLATVARDAHDDGQVIDHVNVEDLTPNPVPGQPPPTDGPSASASDRQGSGDTRS